MRVTIKEVAREAGVSIATVSRVLNDSGPVNETTRQRVEQVALALNYKPHGAARSLITSKTYTIGVLLPKLYGQFYSEIIRGVDQTARRDGFHLIVSSSHDTLSELEAALRAMAGRIDGLVVMCPGLDAHLLKANLPEELPVVVLNDALGEAHYDALNVDNYRGAYEMTRHFLARGHKRIAIIKGESTNHDARERVRGYQAALEDGGITPDRFLEFAGDFTEVSGYIAARRILEVFARPTAVFASNDSMAIGALRAFQEAGLRVPDDIAVGGFDDIPVSQYVCPPLTTVHVAIYQMGVQAATVLLNAIEQENYEPMRRMLPTQLVVRESCGGYPPKARGSLD